MTLRPFAPEHRARLTTVLLALLVLFWGALVHVAAVPSCSHLPERPGAAYVERAAALAFNAAAVSLEVLDAELVFRINEDAERRNLAALPQAELEAALAPWGRRVLELERARDALAIARAWLTGERSDDDGRAALRDAADALSLLADELESIGAPLPERVREGIRAARAFAGPRPLPAADGAT